MLHSRMKFNLYSLGVQTLFVLFGIVSESLPALCNTLKFGPSLSALTSTYFIDTTNKKNWSSSISTKPKILELKDYPNYSVLIPLLEEKVEASGLEVLNELYGSGFGSSMFIVEAPFGFQVMATVQELDLGQSYLNFSTIEKGCGDKFLQFGENVETQTEKICGQVDVTDLSSKPNNLIGPRFFQSKSHQLPVTFHFSTLNGFYVWLYQKRLGNNPTQSTEFKYKLSIAFTAFKDIKASEITTVTYQAQNLVSCTYGNGNDSYINSALFCDGVYNCGSEDYFGFDETKEYCKFLGMKDHGDLEQNSNQDERKISSIDKTNEDKNRYYYPTWNRGPDVDSNTETLEDSITYPSPIQNTDYDDEIDKIIESHLSPASTILLIIFTVVAIMILGIIIRFCCTKCVGTHPVPIFPSTELGSSSTIVDFGSVNVLGPDGSPRIQSQCSRINLATDLPPSYEELFPAWKLALENRDNDTNPNSNNINIIPCVQHNCNVSHVKNSETDNQYV